MTEPNQCPKQTGPTERGRARFGVVAVGLPALIGLILLASSPNALADTLVLLNGKKVSGDVSRIDEGKVDYALSKPGVELAALRSIQRDGVKPVEVKRPAAWVYLVGGGRIVATDIALEKDALTVTWTHGELKLPLDVLQGILLMLPEKGKEVDAAFNKQLMDVAAREDKLFVPRDGNLLAIGGLLAGVSKKEMSFVLGQDTRAIDRSQVYGVTIAHPTIESWPQPPHTLRFRDGSTLAGTIQSLKNGRVTVGLADDATASASWNDVLGVDIKSDRLVYLSDIDPVKVEEDPGLDVKRPWQRDRNVRGGPLRIGDEQFEKGLGVRSRSLLTYDAGGEYARFAATIGIDAHTKGKGDCVFVVTGDGKELARQRVKGEDKPREINIDISGVKQLTLAVEFGEDWSMSDHANWCDARMVKSESN